MAYGRGKPGGFFKKGIAMTFGEQLREKMKAKKDVKDRVEEKLIPSIKKKLDTRAEKGFNHAIIPLNITKEEWDFIIDWCIGEKIGTKVESKNEYRFMW